MDVSEALERARRMCDRVALDAADRAALQVMINGLATKRVRARLVIHLMLPIADVAGYPTHVVDHWGLDEVLDVANPPTIEVLDG